MISIDDFFKCPYTLDRLRNCGYLSEYLDSFADWLAGHHYVDFTIRKHVSHVAHLSRSLGTMPDLKHLPDWIHIFLFKHIPTCQCKGWKHPRYVKAISSSLNRFKYYLIDCICNVDNNKYVNQSYHWDKNSSYYMMFRIDMLYI